MFSKIVTGTVHYNIRKIILFKLQSLILDLSFSKAKLINQSRQNVEVFFWDIGMIYNDWQKFVLQWTDNNYCLFKLRVKGREKKKEHEKKPTMTVWGMSVGKKL